LPPRNGIASLKRTSPAPRTASCAQRELKLKQPAALNAGQKGLRVLIGGRLGRHPRLAQEVAHLVSEKEAARLLERCIRLYQQQGSGEERFAAMLQRLGIDNVIETLRSGS